MKSTRPTEKRRGAPPSLNQDNHLNSRLARIGNQRYYQHNECEEKGDLLKKSSEAILKDRLGVAQIDEIFLQTSDVDTPPLRFQDVYSFQKVIGQGAFGVVVHVMKKDITLSTNQNQEAAIKIINKRERRADQYQAIKNEAVILQQMDHPNIVKFYDIYESPDFIFIEMELLKDGCLKSLIKQKRHFSDQEASAIVRDLLSAVEHIHSKDFVHRDLKPENILLDKSNGNLTVKVADFGLSAFFKINLAHSMDEKMGTLPFMAPEQTKNINYGKRIDIWACGIIMYMLLEAGKHPLYSLGDNERAFLEKLKVPQWSFSQSFTPYSKDLFLKLCNPSPIERYTSEKAVRHPWITRNFKDDVPLTQSQEIREFQTEISLRHAIGISYFMSVTKIKDPKASQGMQAYLEKCRDVASDSSFKATKDTTREEETEQQKAKALQLEEDLRRFREKMDLSQLADLVSQNKGSQQQSQHRHLRLYKRNNKANLRKLQARDSRETILSTASKRNSKADSAEGKLSNASSKDLSLQWKGGQCSSRKDSLSSRLQAPIQESPQVQKKQSLSLKRSPILNKKSKKQKEIGDSQTRECDSNIENNKLDGFTLSTLTGSQQTLSKGKPAWVRQKASLACPCQPETRIDGTNQSLNRKGEQNKIYEKYKPYSKTTDSQTKGSLNRAPQMNNLMRHTNYNFGNRTLSKVVTDQRSNILIQQQETPQKVRMSLQLPSIEQNQGILRLGRIMMKRDDAFIHSFDNKSQANQRIPQKELRQNTSNNPRFQPSPDISRNQSPLYHVKRNIQTIQPCQKSSLRQSDDSLSPIDPQTPSFREVDKVRGLPQKPLELITQNDQTSLQQSGLREKVALRQISPYYGTSLGQDLHAKYFQTPAAKKHHKRQFEEGVPSPLKIPNQNQIMSTNATPKQYLKRSLYNELTDKLQSLSSRGFSANTQCCMEVVGRNNNKETKAQSFHHGQIQF